MVPAADTVVADVQVDLVESTSSVAVEVLPAATADGLVPAPPPVPRPAGAGPNVERRRSSAKVLQVPAPAGGASVSPEGAPAVLTANNALYVGPPSAS